ncbi:uncharacterized protein EI97DRAFT_437136 [Westerdykella ornata]|uniref:Inosine/uridine-preferring nucleoside hydrolase domain-containing protein n=1 Tax=Westerdykella ornata TaxID=318751 RepID=A0A6A6J6P3_WESOR|nr:uncharacterized protein EI97DRAFT_437136 [Westerdykella ornata]KAF2272250.1 hypothetical protein EI97DRAFT_437136 [Westerdykella ornata]
MPVPNVLVVTDIGNDYDDMMALLILGYYHRQKKINLKGIIVTLHPVTERARVTYGLLRNCMGIKDVPVAEGTTGTDNEREDAEWTKIALNAEFSAEPRTGFKNYLELAAEVLTEAKRKREKIRLLSIASIRDIWAIVQQNPSLFKQVVSEIHIQAGCKIVDVGDTYMGKKIEKKKLVANDEARNNSDDLVAANNFYDFIQKNKISCSVYEKQAAFVSGCKKDIFDPEHASKAMKKVATYIYAIHDIQKKVYYKDACKPIAQRRLPWCDEKWFLDYMCKDLPKELVEKKDVDIERLLPYTLVTPYDPIAALGCIEEVAGMALKLPKARYEDVDGSGHQMFYVGSNVSKEAGHLIAEEIRRHMRLALTM